MKRARSAIYSICFGLLTTAIFAQSPAQLVPAKGETSLRLATYNVSLNRKQAGQLKQDLAKNDQQVQAIATVIRLISPRRIASQRTGLPSRC